MQVYKFGGASINSTERLKNTADIINGTQGEVLVVISAMGKTTNALEEVVSAFYNAELDRALSLFATVKQNHIDVVESLLIQDKAVIARLNDFFTEVEWLLHDKAVRNYDYYYDQVVCVGELLSTFIVTSYLSAQNISNSWFDARDIIRTDNNFRDAGIDWQYTRDKIASTILPAFKETNIIITQGFIGSTDENESTTLGREGSDYTAAIFANLLPAKAVTIWKDVEAVMNADPKAYKDAVNIAALSYTEVIEMAYYGAQVIHPKTIKPLQNAGIPLYVKSFLNTALPGTVINSNLPKNMPPVIVLKQNQVLANFKSKDFSFIEDLPNEQLHHIFNAAKIKSNLSQHTAISLLCAFDDHPTKINDVAAAAAQIFDVTIERGLSLLTIRHYNEAIIATLTKEKEIILTQKTTETIQILMRQQ